MIKTNNDLKSAQIATCRNGKHYVIVADDNGHHDAISLDGKPVSNGIEVGTGRLAICGGNSDGGRDIVKIQEFLATSARNRLSEALKTLTGHPYTEVLTTVWEAESEERLRAKAAVDLAKAQLAEAERRLSFVK